MKTTQNLNRYTSSKYSISSKLELMKLTNVYNEKMLQVVFLTLGTHQTKNSCSQHILLRFVRTYD